MKVMKTNREILTHIVDKMEEKSVLFHHFSDKHDVENLKLILRDNAILLELVLFICEED